MTSARGAWLAAVPAAAVVAVDPGGLSPFGPMKWALVPALVTSGLASVLWTGGAKLARLPTMLWAAFLVTASIAALTGADPLYAWIGTPERHFGVVTWLLCGTAFAAGQLARGRVPDRIMTGAAVATGLAAVWAVAEAFGWSPFDVIGSSGRPGGPLGSSAFLGAAMVLLVPVTIGVAVRDRHRLAAAAAGFGAVALVLSGARAAWIGAAVAGAVVLFVRRPPRALGLVAVVVAAVAGVAVASGVGARFDPTHGGGGGAGGRLDEWRIAARAVADNAFTGVGPEGYRIVFPRYVDAEYEQAHGRNPLPDRAHSTVLDIAVTTGLPGLALYLALMGVVGTKVIAALRRGTPALAGAAAGLLAYAVQSLFLFPVAELDIVAWLMAGTIVAAVGHNNGQVAVLGRRPLAGVAVAASVIALLAGGADVLADRAARRTMAAGAVSTTKEAERAAGLRPDALRYRLVAARAYEDRASVSGLRAALGQLERAADLSPGDPYVRHERARLLLALARETDDEHDRARAGAVLARLVADDPHSAEGWLRLGVLHALDDDLSSAVVAWRKAEHLAPRSSAASTDLAIAFAQAGRWEDARAAARTALSREPGNARARQVLEAADGT